MVLKARLGQQFDIPQIVPSPFSWLGPRLATQVCFVCRRRPPSLRFGEASG